MTFEERLDKALSEGCDPHKCAKCKEGTVVNGVCDKCKKKVELDQT